MKIDGKKVEGVNIETIVIPRGEDFIVFKAQAIQDMKEFDKLCPTPKPPSKMRPGGKKELDYKDKEYLESIDSYSTNRFAYTIIKSLEATPNLEWETVNINDPNTWRNYDTELRSSGFNTAEINMILNGVLAANALNEAKIEEARRRFLAGQERLQKELSSLQEEVPSILSGEPANE